MSVPQFKDVSKAANNVLTKDFYHAAPLALEVRTKAPNGVSFAVDGKYSKGNTLASKLEAEVVDKASGVTLTQGWSSANVLNTKIALAEAFTPGLKGEIDTTFTPASAAKTAKLGLTYSQPSVNLHVLVDALKGPNFSGDVVFGHKGAVGGGEIAYDVASGKISRYSAVLGYIQRAYSVTLSSSNNLSVYSASVWHKANPATEIGARANWDSKQPSASGVSIEAAVKHTLDSSAFVKARLDNKGIAWLAYSQVLRPGVTFGAGVLADTQQMSAPAHKFGLSLKFSA